MDAPIPVLLLHAAGRTPQMWQNQVEAIGMSRPALAPWLRGLRPGRKDELSLADAADEVLSTMDRNGIESAVLIGHQLGAMVALQVAATEPDMVAGLVLSGAVVAPSSLALGLQRMVIRLLPNKSLAESGATRADLLRALDLIATADFGKNLGRITAPALIIAGSGDPGRSAAQELAERVPNGRFAEISGVGTDPNLEAPAAYNGLLLEFL
ncbi:MAG: alpha/beta hydrolase, partial [Propionibacteriales bacterium]|nr:alpha/beta hydrolase [Propionibacteriales bacterium]